MIVPINAFGFHRLNPTSMTAQGGMKSSTKSTKDEAPFCVKIRNLLFHSLKISSNTYTTFKLVQ